MRTPLLAVLATLLAFAGADPALARWSHSSGGGHSSGGRHTPPGTYIKKKCKTAACFRKHPAGYYGFVTGQRK